jgi:hypothetical protein
MNVPRDGFLTTRLWSKPTEQMGAINEAVLGSAGADVVVPESELVEGDLNSF